jgi:hypothetical protein
MLPKPTISWPEAFDCGVCQRGTSVTRKFVCTQTEGAPTVCTLSTAEERPQDAGGDCLTVGNFSIEPVTFNMNVGKSVEFTVTFRPPDDSYGLVEMPIFCHMNNPAWLELNALRGTSAPINLVLTHVDSAPVVAAAARSEDAIPLVFDPVVLGTTVGRALTVRNDSPFRLPFQIELHAAGRGAEDGRFSVTPSEGFLEPMADQHFLVQFGSVGERETMVAATALLKAPAGIANGGDVWGTHLRVQCVAQIRAAQVTLSPCTLALGNMVRLSDLRSAAGAVLSAQLTNEAADGVSRFSIDAVDTGEFRVEVSPSEGAVRAGETCSLSVALRARDADAVLDELAATLTCRLSGGLRVPICVKASVLPPDVRFSLPAGDNGGAEHLVGLDFGVLNFGLPNVRATRVLVVRNAGEDSSPVQLRERASPSGEASVLEIEPAEFVLAPGEVRQVEVTFVPRDTGAYQSSLECAVERAPLQLLRLSALVAAPLLAVEPASANLEELFVGVPLVLPVRLVNHSALATVVHWDDVVEDGFSAVIEPSELVVPPDGAFVAYVQAGAALTAACAQVLSRCRPPSQRPAQGLSASG